MSISGEKRRICLVTNWYPTVENPYQGVFFKEQAFAVSDSFDFVVIHYSEKKSLLYSRATVRHVRNEKNTYEYGIHARVPFWIWLPDYWEKVWAKIRKGSIRTDHRHEYTKRVLNRIFPSKKVGKIDVLYCVDAQSEASILSILSECMKIPYIVSEHAPFPWPGKVVSESAKTAIENADLFFAISCDKVRQVLLQNVKLPTVVYIGNLVDESQFSLIEKRDECWIKTIIIVAAHSYYKNYDPFVSIMDRLVEISNVPFHAMIVGYASNKGYSQGIQEFEEQIQKSRFADRVELIPEVPHAQIHEYYQRADAFVMTSIQEGQPVSALEAGCCGLPIFSTRCGGVEDYVTKDLGRIYSILDKDGFAHGLKDFLEERIQFDNQLIRETIVSRFGKKAFSDIFKDAVSGVINNAKD